MIEFDAIPQEDLVHILGLVKTAERSPPPDFDPAKASNDELEAYWLPARPDRERLPGLHAVWEEMVAEPFRFRIPTFPKLPEDRHRRALIIRRAVRAEQRSKGLSSFIRGHLHDSRNWSGAYLTPRHPERFTLVAGKWAVPDPQVPAAASVDSVEMGGDYRSSTWIGFGGKRPYNPLPQIGTSQHVQNDRGVHKAFGAWWQWWLRGDESHHHPIPILNFDVAAGHVIVALLLVTAAGEVQFFLRNRTTGVYVTFRVSVPGYPYPLGATAEWVHERPTQTGSEKMYPLPKCTPVRFRNCLAASADQPGAIARFYNLDRSRFVRMHESFNNPFRSAFVSVPKRAPGPSALDVNYRDPLTGALFA